MGGRTLRAVMLVGAALACAPGAPVAQERAPALAELARSVVRVGRGPSGGGRCTGVFIGPGTVLTAGHCTVERRAWNQSGVRDLTVWHEERPLAVTAVRLSPVSPFAPRGGIADLGNDWAVLEVAVPAESGVVPLPYLGAAAARRAFVTEAPVLKAGFDPEGRGDYALRSTAGCAVVGLAAASTSFLFRCGDGLGEGASGSALLVAEGGRWGVAGLMSGKREAAGQALGIAVVPPAEALRGP